MRAKQAKALPLWLMRLNRWPAKATEEIAQQASAIDEIATNVNTASTLSSQSSHSMRSEGQSIEETKAVSVNVSSLANSLNGHISKLQSEISEFLDDVKSA